MSNKESISPRQIKRSTSHRLYALSGNMCAYNYQGDVCKEKLYEPDTPSSLGLGQICHIEAAKKGGQRYNKNSNDNDRRSFDNLLLLCPNHHKVTDNVEVYTVEVMRKMKENHEEKFFKNYSLSHNPTILFEVVKILSSNPVEYSSKEPINAPNPEEKIKYNNVLKYQPIIEKYKIYHDKLDKIYQEIEEQGSNKKEVLLKYINSLYLKEKGKYKISEINSNADNIFKSIEEELWEKIHEESSRSIYEEALYISILIVMVDAFMRCKILEEPPKNDSR